jgi:ferric-dicitrate binding protein FerR (iron transport regulator)
MQPDQQLINRFYQGKCTPQEAQQVMNWLLQNETMPSLENDWLQAERVGKYPRPYEKRMLVFILQHIKRPAAMRRLYRAGWAVAASIILVAGLSIVLLHQTKKTGVTAQQNTVSNKQLVVLYAPANKPSTIKMVDGSIIVLEPGAVLRYNVAGYNAKNRIVSLQGQAVFFVAPNTNKPFSVLANGFSTTALGTSFLVKAKPAGDIQVKLYTGKVVIRQLGVAHANEVYLAPGEEMVLGNSNHQPMVNRWLPEKTVHEEQSENKLATTKEVQFTGDTLVFNNAPLATVLNVLKHRYRVHIHYNQHRVDNAYFTGSVLPGDAIELILKTVTRINGLTLIAAGDGFTIE